MNPFATIKYKLSHIKASSWHYRLTKGIWGKDTRGKTCTYYWVKLPGALLVWCVVLVIYLLVLIVGGFFGSVPTEFPTTNEKMRPYQHEPGRIFYPYKTFPSGKKMLVAPWEIVLLAGMLYVLYYFAFLDRNLGVYVGVGLLVIGLFAVLAFFLTKSWQSEPIQAARHGVEDAWGGVTNAWDRICPPLVIEDNHQKSQTEE